MTGAEVEAVKVRKRRRRITTDTTTALLLSLTTTDTDTRIPKRIPRETLREIRIQRRILKEIRKIQRERSTIVEEDLAAPHQLTLTTTKVRIPLQSKRRKLPHQPMQPLSSLGKPKMVKSSEVPSSYVE